ncbi:MAG: hypothetical protein WA005_00010 [Candidatus Binataceae bacterium]
MMLIAAVAFAGIIGATLLGCQREVPRPSNVDLAREHWCKIALHGEESEAGITELLAKIDANACAEMQANGVDIKNGCASGRTRQDVSELLRQAGQDWENGIYHCKDGKVE